MLTYLKDIKVKDIVKLPHGDDIMEVTNITRAGENYVIHFNDGTCDEGGAYTQLDIVGVSAPILSDEDALASTPIDTICKIGSRLHNTLKLNGITTLGQLTSITESELSSKVGMGTATLREAKDLLADYGLDFVSEYNPLEDMEQDVLLENLKKLPVWSVVTSSQDEPSYSASDLTYDEAVSKCQSYEAVAAFLDFPKN